MSGKFALTSRNMRRAKLFICKLRLTLDIVSIKLSKINYTLRFNFSLIILRTESRNQDRMVFFKKQRNEQKRLCPRHKLCLQFMKHSQTNFYHKSQKIAVFCGGSSSLNLSFIINVSRHQVSVYPMFTKNASIHLADHYQLQRASMYVYGSKQKTLTFSQRIHSWRWSSLRNNEY